MALRQSIGFVAACISGGTIQPGGVVSSPHTMGQYPIGALLGIGVEVLVLRWRAGVVRKLLLSAREVERLAKSGAGASIMR